MTMRLSAVHGCALAVLLVACHHGGGDGGSVVSESETPAAAGTASSAASASTSTVAPAAIDAAGMTPKQLIEATWPTVPREEKDVCYSEASLPPLPVTWPKPANAPVTFRTYGYAYGLNPQIADGEHDCSPWISVTGPRNGPFVVARTKMRELGIQGVQPVAANTYPTEAERAAAITEIENGAATPSDIVKKLYCTLPRYNGVIMGAVAKDHAAFFAWLACK